jgi:hypothetical protein
MIITIYPGAGNGWVAAVNGVWIPGGYDTGQTAMYACQFPDEVLQPINDKIYSVNGEDRPITMADLPPQP